MGDLLASEHEKRRENCWGQAACVNGTLGAMCCVSAPVPWQALFHQSTGKKFKCLGVLVG